MSCNNFFMGFFNELPVHNEDEYLRQCFNNFDENKDGGLDLQEFNALAKSLLTDSKGEPYYLTSSMVSDMFCVFDQNKDGKIDTEEMKIVWYDWIKVIVHPVSALLVIDVQNDFISGTLALRHCPAGHEGEEIVPVINNLLKSVRFESVVYSVDWHPADHISFFENFENRKIKHLNSIPSREVRLFDEVVFDGSPPTKQKLWPRHCVQNTWGAKLHQDLILIADNVMIHKGIHSKIDSYSAFRDNQKISETKLQTELKAKKVTDVYICGLAYDVCVGFTAIDAVEYGYRTVVVEDATRGVCPKGIAATREKLVSHNCVIVTHDKVQDMVKGLDRRPELAYQTAMALTKPALTNHS
ncbi:uncharacterized protein LOC106460685 [Limulus polyphemus]|uniref:nicotinamidase n=1 Tax=Limulus polyphemus TaxID=6850 RepID=A0ABM1B6M9_LIMPO|nr:uncharacterized protein LOC106460685 [Limulus polyphemus]